MRVCGDGSKSKSSVLRVAVGRTWVLGTTTVRRCEGLQTEREADDGTGQREKHAHRRNDNLLPWCDLKTEMKRGAYGVVFMFIVT